MKTWKSFAVCMLMTMTICFAAGCGAGDDADMQDKDPAVEEKENTEDRVTEPADREDGSAADDLGDAVQDAGEGVGDAVQDVGEGVGNAVKDTGDAVEDVLDGAAEEKNNADRNTENNSATEGSR